MGRWFNIPWVGVQYTHGILTPTLGLSTPYPWYFDPSTPGISTALPMVFWSPYPWYIDPSIHGILTPLPMGVQFTIQGGQDTIWHRSFLHSWPITGFVIRLTRRVPLVEQEQLTFHEHPSLVPVLSGVCVTRSLVLCVCFVDHCLPFCPFLPLRCPSFDLRIPFTPLVSWNSY